MDLTAEASQVQGYLCVSVDPRRAWTAKGGETFIITKEEFKILIQDQQKTEDQKIWLTTAQASERLLKNENLESSKTSN